MRNIIISGIVMGISILISVIAAVLSKILGGYYIEIIAFECTVILVAMALVGWSYLAYIEKRIDEHR